MNASMKTAARRIPRWVWFAGPLLVAGFFTWEWVNSSRQVDTDNAYVKAERIMVSAQVGGRVVEVAVGQDAPVRKGALLFRLDDAPLKIALDQAQARLAMVDNQASATRAQDLARRQLIPRKTLDDAVHALAEARSQHAAAVATQSQAAAALGGDASIPSKQLPEYRDALAAVEKAQFDLAQAAVYAPVDGVVGNHDLQPGEYLNAGQVAMPLVASDPVWIEANFKETDLAKLRIGQSAGIKVDSYPGVEWTARVASIAPTSGSEFSVLPAQNATGNWVKVVQRIPVRLELVTRGEHPQVLRSGMSAEVKVDVADAPAADHARPAAAVAVH